jgi:hypothetical protein
MGFIHHTAGATRATGLMAESARMQGSTYFGHHDLPATDLHGLSISTALIGGYRLYQRLRRTPDHTFQAIDNHALAVRVKHVMTADEKRSVGVQTQRNHTLVAATLTTLPMLYYGGRMTVAGEILPGRETVDSIPLYRHLVFKRQDH